MYRRGAVWMADLPDVGRKPAVIVSSRLVTLKLNPIVARITSVARERTIETVVPLDHGEVEGLPNASFILGHDIYTLSEGGLVKHLGWLQSDRMMQVEEAVLTALGVEPS
ncbi:MAG TPA: type II toxin-antitoxin system PemK/MazF family toxin [Solirubrobacteraceae bacterium]|nr:type II toxin-antitoxin system PemK/MazF family toxin [Solirubrobacteraceae bacterium]